MKLNEVYTLTNGIFTDLQSLDVPWKENDMASQLDIAYLGNHSGQKTISPLLRQFIEDGEISSENRATVASVVFALYAEQWLKLWATMEFEYNPIENYRMVEEHTGTETGLDTPNNWQNTKTDSFTNYKETTTETPNEKVITETETFTDYHETSTQKPDEWKKETKTTGANDSANSVQNKVVPINSNASQLTSESESHSDVEESQTGTFETDLVKSGSREVTRADEGTMTTELAITGTKAETENQTGTFERKMTYNTKLERSGNIGVTTSQQMIESERNLWQWNYFYKVVFPDIDRVLTLAIY